MENRKPVPFTTEGIRRGIVQAYPLFFASLTYGVAFGLLAREVGLSVLEALLMSAAVYSGSAQIAALTIMDNADPWTSASVVALTELLDPGSDMDRLHSRKRRHTARLAPQAELGRTAHVGAPCVRVADMDGEEL